MEGLIKFLGVLTLGLLIIGFVSVAFAFPTKWLVNYLFTPCVIHSLFGVGQISVYQALALNFLCGTLFKGSSSNSSSK